MSPVSYYNQSPIYSALSSRNSSVYSNFSNYGGYYYPAYPQEVQNESNADIAADTAGKAVILQALTIGIQKASEFLSKKLISGKEFTSTDNVVKTAKNMILKNGLSLNVGFIDELNKHNFVDKYGIPAEFDVVAKGQNAFYSDELKLAVAPKSRPSLILHELGHAINAKGKFTKLLQNSRRYAMYAPSALLIANKITKDPKKKEKSFIEKHATALGFCAFLPTIIEEGLASLRGIKAAKSTLGKIPNLSVLGKNYALALGTYILSGLTLGLAAKETIDCR